MNTFKIVLLLFLSIQILFGQYEKSTKFTGSIDSEGFGRSLAFSDDGKIFAVGSYGSNTNGKVRVFQYSAGTYTQLGADFDGEVSSDLFGHSIALSADGTRIVIGASNNTNNGNLEAGKVYIYDFDGTNWNLVGNTIGGGAVDAEIGIRVEMSANGNRVLVSSLRHTNSNGLVRLYEFNSGTNTWDQLGSDIVGTLGNESLGRYTALASGGTIFSVCNRPSNQSLARVDVYEESGGVITLLQSLTTSESADLMDTDIANNGKDIFFSKRGFISHFKYDVISTSWLQVGSDIPVTAAQAGPTNMFGRSISVSEDAKMMIVGAPVTFLFAGSGIPYIQIYKYSTSWKAVGEPFYKNEQDFGNAVLISNDKSSLAVGCFSCSENGLSLNGYAQTYQFEAPGGVGTDDELRVWLKANEGAEAITVEAQEGNQVDNWADYSHVRGNAATDNASTMNAPTYKDNVSDNINYNPVIYFDGTDDALSFDEDYIYANNTKSGMTFFTLVKPDNTAVTKTRQYIFDFGSTYSSGYGLGYSSNTTYIYASGTKQAELISNNTAPALLTYEIDFGNSLNLYKNGNSASISTAASAPTELTAANINESPNPGNGRGPFCLGRQTKANNITNDDGRFYQGAIAEIAGYGAVLTPNKKKVVESYFALKYGITLGHNYTNTAFTDIYDVSNYNTDIIGIAADPGSDLVQKQSTSANAEQRIYISTLAASNKLNAGTFSNETTFLVAGHNATIISNTGSTEYPNGQGITGRVNREWKVENTEFAQTFSMDVLFPNSTPIDPAHLVLLVDDDGDFSNATVHTPTFSFGSSYITISDISTAEIPVNSTRFITIASTNSATTLPIDLLHFAAKPLTDKSISLNWNVSDKMARHFVIERSTSKNTRWEAIHEQAAQQYEAYSHIDESPYFGINYYRLKIIDEEEQVTYSEVKAATIEQLKRFSIYPNPTDDIIHVENINNSLLNIELCTIDSRVLRKLSTSDSRATLALNNLPAGSYFLRITDHEHAEVYHLIKK